MKMLPIQIIRLFRSLSLLMILLCCDYNSNAQKQEADSLQKLLSTDLHDTMRVKNMRYLSYALYKYDTDSALKVAYKGLQLAKKISYKAGISNSYEMIGSILTRTGNYNSALHYYIENLKIEESLQSIDGIIIAKNNIGIVYTYLEDYENAIRSYLISDSLVKIYSDADTAYVYELKYLTALNMGDVYEKMQRYEEAFLYYNKSLELAITNKENYRIGKSMLGLANIYAARQMNDLALAKYKISLNYLAEANDEDLLCEASLGVAKVYKKMLMNDSALLYARRALHLAQKDKFMSRELALSNFLTNYFEEHHQTDSAFYYLRQSKELNDSLLGIEKLRVSEQITFNENLRQLELLEMAQQAKEDRRQQLQHIFIVLLIPTLFFITMLLARVRISVKLLKFLGVISLLFLFEYLTLLLHPIVQKITHHTPVFEILIFVAIAAIIIPSHHKIEHWLIELLVKRVKKQQKAEDPDEGLASKTEVLNVTDTGVVAQSKPVK